ncbi:MAG: DNA adenine methylase [Rhodanobacteraceae bacterium]|nr:MAG: DNA adenine methylase [Rhodanobacteraceae bacterium]
MNIAAPASPDLFARAGAPYHGGTFKTQLLKWVGSKQRQAPAIIKYFPAVFNTYLEPFLGSGGILGALSPRQAIAGDTFAPLVQIWQALATQPDTLKAWYAERHALIAAHGKEQAYADVLEQYNQSPNGADLVFLCRACYGGVVRFRKADGYMSTPCGPHDPIAPESFSKRVDAWVERTRGTQFIRADFRETMDRARRGDLVYCDPPYADSQAILYGAQDFSLATLFETVQKCKERGVFVALSIDGSKYSGAKLCNLPIPDGLFEHEYFIEIGRSMLKRFQMDGRTLEAHGVADRLLLTY